MARTAHASLFSVVNVTGEGGRERRMFRAIVVLLVVLAYGSAQSNTSCVQVFDNSITDSSLYYDYGPSFMFTLEGASSVETNTVSLYGNTSNPPGMRC